MSVHPANTANIVSSVFDRSSPNLERSFPSTSRIKYFLGSPRNGRGQGHVTKFLIWSRGGRPPMAISLQPVVRSTPCLVLGLVGASAQGPAYSWVHCQHVQHYTLGAGAPLLACVSTPSMLRTAHILRPGGPLPHAKNEVDRTTRSREIWPNLVRTDRQTDWLTRDRHDLLTNQPAVHFASTQL